MAYNQLLQSADTNIELLRIKRDKAFKGFDIYKQNVNYGIIKESKETHIKIVNWYNDCLDLDSQAINNVPTEIKKYIKH